MMKGGLAGLMKQAQVLQENMKKGQEQLAQIEVEGQAGAGMVKVVMTCSHDVRRAFQSEVLPFERPDQVVVEVGHVTGAIVAALAVEAELVGVVGHEDRIALLVAGGA